MGLDWNIKSFESLTVNELYEILSLRSAIFVVEQNCVYHDMDGKDALALHLLGTLDGKIVAYARLFKPNDYFEKSSIGRVIVDQDFRDKKLGHFLMREAIEAIRNHFGETQITISAQLYLKIFYESLGFIQTSEMYLEDDIPHIEMEKE